MPSEPRCSRHGSPLPPECPGCRTDSQRPVHALTVEERVEELACYMAALPLPFQDVHERAEDLVGRPVWTHEFAQPHLLYEEIRTGEPPKNLGAHVVGLLGDMMGDKPIVVVKPEEASDAE